MQRIEELADQFDATELAVVEYHAWWPGSNDPFYLANVDENQGRIQYYNVSGVPSTWASGDELPYTYPTFPQWDDVISNQLNSASPLSIELSLTGWTEVTATITAEQNLSGFDNRLHFVLIESNLVYGGDVNNYTMRDMLPDENGQPLTISQGQTVTIAAEFAVDESWNRNQMEIIVFAQNNQSRDIYQTARIGLPALSVMEHHVTEVVGDNDERLEDGETGQVIVSLTNFGFAAGFTNVSAELTSQDPAISIASGPLAIGTIDQDMIVDNSTAPFEFTVNPGFEPHWSTFEVVATSDQTISVYTFEILLGRPLLIIDNDGGSELETFFLNDLAGMGLTYEHWEFDGAVMAPYYEDYPAMLWYTGDAGNGLSTQAIDFLTNFLQAGKNLILTGQDIAETLPPGNTFLSSMIGVEPDGNYMANPIRVMGASEDVFFGELSLILMGGNSAVNQTSADILQLTAGSSARPILNYASGDLCGVRYADSTRGYKVVYTGFGLEGIGAAGAFDNRSDFLNAAFEYFNSTLGVEDDTRLINFGLAQNYPNPFNLQTTFAYRLANPGKVTLNIYNLSGQLVKILETGVKSAGGHEITWDGTNDLGQAVGSGVYLYRLQTAENQSKMHTMIRLK